MITRDLNEDKTVLIRHEDHADLAAQFAAHLGNDIFSRTSLTTSFVLGAAYHDHHYRDLEAPPPIDFEKGRPHGHRTTPFAPSKLSFLENNVDWVARQDPYASVLVSMHHTGLPQGRYGKINSWQNGQGAAPARRQLAPELAAFIAKMEGKQRDTIQDLGRKAPLSDEQVWFDYRRLQLCDLLSLYFCTDGYDKGQLHEANIGPVPTAPGSSAEHTIRITPINADRVRFDPYPFDCPSLEVSVMTRTVTRRPGGGEADYLADYWRAPRHGQSWTITP